MNINFFQFVSMLPMEQYSLTNFKVLKTAHLNHSRENLFKIQALCWAFYFRSKLVIK